MKPANDDETDKEMDKEINRLFENLRNNTEKTQRQNAIMMFTQQMGEQQAEMIREQKSKIHNPPNVDRDWAPQSVHDANESFGGFTSYAHSKDGEIDESGLRLKGMNDFMISKLNEIFGIEDSPK